MEPEHKPAPDFVFHIEREFDTSLSKMWELWSREEMFAQWFGPKGGAIDVLQFDLRAGGETLYRIELDGQIMFGKWLFTEVRPQEKITGIIVFTDETGENIIEHILMPGWPLKILSEVFFTEVNGKTKISINWSAYEASASESKAFEDGAPSCHEGWTGTFDMLEDLIRRSNQ